MPPPDLPSRVRGRADLEALLAATTNYEERRPPRAAADRLFNLARVERLLAAVGDPQRGPRTVHVAGSKGKGTVVRLLAATLGAAGRGPVGCYTSPHLEDLSERIALDGRPASDEALARAADRCLPHVRTTRDGPDAPTFFELLTAVAWLVFREAGASDVVLETGLGGRLDATTVCQPSATIVTSIEREHADVLGDDLAAIAREKAGILVAGVPAAAAVDGAARAVIEEEARRVGAPLALVGREVLVEEARTTPGPCTRVGVRFAGEARTTWVTLPLAGAHHASNVALVAWAARTLGLEDGALVRAAAVFRPPAVMEPLGASPLVILDGAHTPASVAAACAALADAWPGRRVVGLVALMGDKDQDAVARALAPALAAAIASEVPSPRALPAAALAGVLARAGLVAEAIPDPIEALARARAQAGPDGLVLVTGSIRLAGLLRPLLAACRPRVG